MDTDSSNSLFGRFDNSKFITALSGIRYEVTPLITGMCIAGLAIALAAKNVLSNVFGGVAITVDQLYKVGDRIEMGGAYMVVKTTGSAISSALKKEKKREKL